MKTALVLGSTGNFGSQMVRALTNNGWSVTVFKRNKSSTSQKKGDTAVTVFSGDINSKTDLLKATENVDLIVYGLNPPYTQWRADAYRYLDTVADVAQQRQLHILFPGNVYSLPASTDNIDESSPMIGQTEKGQIRLNMEQRLKRASENGARVTIIRAGDFIGDDGQWFNLVFKPKHQNWVMSSPHNGDHRHYWSYLPNLCFNTVQLLERLPEKDHCQFEVFHDPGVVASTDDWVDAFNTHDVTLKVKPFPWWMISVSSVVVPMFKEVLEMRYLWKDPIILDGSKLKHTLGDVFRPTTLEQVAGQTIANRRA